MHIGMIGGFGPVATTDYYLRLVAAAEADGVPLRLTLAHGDLATAYENLKSGHVAEQVQIFVDHVEELRHAGAEIAVFVSLSLHTLLDQVTARASLPFCSILRALTEHAERERFQRIGVVGSGPAMTHSVLGAYAGLDCLAPEDEAERDALNTAYFEMAFARHCTEHQRALFDSAAEKLMDRGAEAILLGGTDLSLAYGRTPPDFPAIDPVAVHVDALWALAAKR